MSDPTGTPNCPNGHGPMTYRPGHTYEQRWVGEWFGCRDCTASALNPSSELRAYLAERADTTR